MPSRTLLQLQAALLCAVGLLVQAAAARAGESCDVSKYRGPVSLLILQSAARVHEFAASLKGEQMVLRGAETVIFGDGRVVTSNVDAASEHLNEIGWIKNRISIVASLPRRASRPRLRG